MAKRVQYDQFTSGIPNSQAAERVSADKFYRNIETPIANWKTAAAFSVAAVLAPFLSFVNVAPQTVPVVSQQDANVVYQTTTQYQQFTGDKLTLPVSRLFIDKYDHSQSIPVWDVPRQQYTYPYLSFEPDIPKAAPVISLENNVVYHQRTTQYQRLAFTPSPRVETITVDKWNPQKPDKIFDLQRNQHLYPSTSFNPELLASEEAVTIDKWTGGKPDVLFDVKRQQYLYPSFFTDPSELNNLNKWIGKYPNEVYDVKRNQHLYPNFFTDPTAGVTYADRWHPKIEDPPKDIQRNQYLYPYYFFVNEAPQTIPVISGTSVNVQYDKTVLYQALAQSPFFVAKVSVDMWHPISNEPYLKLVQNQHLYPSLAFTEAIFNETTSVDRWEGYQPSFVLDVARRQYTYPSLSHVFAPSATIGIFTPVQNTIVSKIRFQYQSVAAPVPIIVLPDKYIGNKPDIVFDVKRQQYVYPSEFRTEILTPVSEPINADSYHPDILFDVKRQQYLYPPFTIDVNQLTQPERVSIDKYAGNKPDKIFDVVREQYLYPYLAYDPQPFPNPISADSWHPLIQQPRFDIARNQYLYPFSASNPELLPSEEVITADKWIGNKPDYLFDVKRQQYAYPTLFVDPQPFPNPPTVDMWVPETQRPPKDVVRNQYLYPTSVIDTNQLTRPEQVSIDRYVGQKPDFIYDVKRQQYTYPFVSAFDFREIPTQEPESSFGYHPDFIYDVKRQQYTYPSEFRTEILTPVSEPVGADSYHPDIIYDVKRQQYTYPSLFRYSMTFPDLTDIYVNMYDLLQSVPVYDVKRQQYTYPTFFMYTFPLPPAIHIIEGSGTYPDYIYGVERRQYNYPVFFNNTQIYIVHVLKEPKPGGTRDRYLATTGFTRDKFGSLSGFTSDKLAAPTNGKTIDGDNTE